MAPQPSPSQQPEIPTPGNDQDMPGSIPREQPDIQQPDIGIPSPDVISPGSIPESPTPGQY